jgi:hypothetical protein
MACSEFQSVTAVACATFAMYRPSRSHEAKYLSASYRGAEHFVVQYLMVFMLTGGNG